MARFVHPQFPNSNTDPFYLTSPDTPNYNCIAWAYGDSNKWFWPDSSNMYYWPDDIPRLVHINNFVQLFESIGYFVCDSFEREENFEKIVIYTDHAGIPTHAARQLENGYWTSKLGASFDISHTLVAMSDGYYGNATIVMKRGKVF